MPKQGIATQERRREPSRGSPDGRTPTWDVAYLFPPQGAWAEEDFWALDSLHDGSPRVELVNGHLDVLPVPTILHQLIAAFLYDLLKKYVKIDRLGVVLFSGTKVRVGRRQYRDPDVVFLKAKRFGRRRDDRAVDGADLVIEVVSPDPKDEERDWKTKPREYARARIPEYWIVDPQKKVIRVLTLRGKTYRVHGDFKPGEQAASVLLPGFTVAVAEALAPPGSEDAD